MSTERVMKWIFSDGTVAFLGGQIDGATAFAQELRDGLKDPDAIIGIWPIGYEAVPLDRNDPAIFDHYLREELTRPCNKWMMVSLTSAPEVPPLPVPPEDDQDLGEEVLY